MGLYQLKPTFIEAVQYDGVNDDECIKFAGGYCEFDGVLVGDYLVKSWGETYWYAKDDFENLYTNPELKSRSLDTEFIHDGFYHDS
jgi:hypothetical protein